MLIRLPCSSSTGELVKVSSPLFTPPAFYEESPAQVLAREATASASASIRSRSDSISIDGQAARRVPSSLSSAPEEEAKQTAASAPRTRPNMVTLDQIRSSNARIGTHLPPGLVAVFVGGTSGIGEATLRQLARHAVAPRIYFIGRSAESGFRLAADLQAINPDGQYRFFSADISLLQNVDEVCTVIRERESHINLLFLTTGTKMAGKETNEGLYYTAAVTYYSRIRFVVDLLPLLQRAPALRRVVSVFNGTKEGHVDETDWSGVHLSLLRLRDHASSMMTLALESLAFEAPDVSFVHTFPGYVRTNLSKDVKTVSYSILRATFKVLAPLVTIPLAEAGERQLFFATSARFPARSGVGVVDVAETAGVPVSGNGSTGGMSVAVGTDARKGSGVYSINSDGEPPSMRVLESLQKMRDDEVLQRAWAHTEEEFTRVTGSAFLVDRSLSR